MAGLETFFFWEADHIKRAAFAQVFVFGDGRPGGGPAQLPCPFDHLVEVFSGLIIDGYERGHIVLVIADAYLGDRFAEFLFDEDSVSDGLDAIAGPRKRFVVLASPATAAFMFIGDPEAVAASDGVHFAGEPPFFAGDLEGPFFGGFIIEAGNVVMEAAPGIDGGIGHTDFLDFFEVEESFAVKEGMERHDADRRLVRRGAPDLGRLYC